MNKTIPPPVLPGAGRGTSKAEIAPQNLDRHTNALTR